MTQGGHSPEFALNGGSLANDPETISRIHNAFSYNTQIKLVEEK
jgi:hypothetical protein